MSETVAAPRVLIMGVGPEALFSTLGRTAARGVETLVKASAWPP